TNYRPRFRKICNDTVFSRARRCGKWTDNIAFFGSVCGDVVFTVNPLQRFTGINQCLSTDIRDGHHYGRLPVVSVLAHYRHVAQVVAVQTCKLGLKRILFATVFHSTTMTHANAPSSCSVSHAV